MCRKTEDLTGRRFGRLTVIGRGEDYITPSSGQKTTRWLCKCDCGAFTNTIGWNLQNGITRSCGCLAKQTNQEVLDWIFDRRKQVIK